MLAGLLVLLIAAVAIFDAGCAFYPRPVTPALRPVSMQLDYALRVETTCLTGDPRIASDATVAGGMGSAVILDARHALTANHVIACTYLADIHVVIASGRRLHARVDKSWPERDIARLVLVSDTFGVVPPVRIGQPATGAVCSASAVPTREGACGTLTLWNDAPFCRDGEWCSDMNLAIQVLRGNSGSGLYNEAGELIGLVTGGGFNADMKPNGDGFATSLWALRDEVTA